MSEWVEWEGGRCPVPYDTMVEVKTRGGGGRVVAGTVRWGHAAHPEDIVAYRVVRPAEQPRTLTGIWVEWKGGECPVPSDTRVEVRLRAGEADVGHVAGDFWWDHRGETYDIVAYRVVTPVEKPGMPAEQTDGWVRRDAFGCWGPLPAGDTLVEVRVRDGEEGVDIAQAFDWSVVAAYRVVAPAEQPVNRGGAGAVETLRRAADLIEQRGKQRDRDTGERSMARTVAAFNAIYGANLTETQGWHFMELLKMARSSQGNYVADDFDDKVAYAALAAECEAGARGRTD